MLSVGLNYALGVLFPVFMESFNESRERTGKLNNLPSTLSFLFCLDPVGHSCYDLLPERTKLSAPLILKMQ